MGNTIATYSGGYQQHIYLGSSSDSGIYGNDRETMTYDNAGNTYFGRVRNVSADGLKYSVVGAPQTRFNRANIVGGVMVVITGTGAGQYRRITSTFSDNQFTIDTPLAVPVAKDGAIEVMPLRGRNIFYNQHYEDVGPFQFYGTGIDNIVYGLTMARGGGIAAWGQWRSHFGNPNLRNQFLGCTVLEGLRSEHQETPLGTGGFGDPLAFNGHVFAIAGAACGEGKDAGMPCEGRYYNQTFHTGGTNATLREMNRLIVFRRNEARSNGGFWLGPAIDVLVEGNTVSNTPAGSVAGTGAFPVSDASRGVLLLNNRCNNGTLATASKLGGETAPTTPLKSDDHTPPHLNGIFLSLSARNADFSAAQWRAEFQAMRAVKIEFVVIRSLLNGANSYTTGGCVMAFYNLTLTPAECYKRVGSAEPGGTLGLILEQAAAVGLGVHFGGLMPSARFRGPGGKTREGVVQWYRALANLQVRCATDVWRQFPQHRSVIRGFYTDLEENNQPDMNRSANDLAAHYLNPIAEDVKRLSLSLKVWASPYAVYNWTLHNRTVPREHGQLLDATEYALFWSGILKTAPAFDFIAPQDSVGWMANTLPEVAASLTALRGVTEAAKPPRELWSNVELFEGWPAGCWFPTKCGRHPATIERITAQIGTESQLATTLIAWSWGMLSPSGFASNASAALYKEYARYIAGAGSYVRVKNDDNHAGKVCAIAAHGASPSSDDNAAAIQAALTECSTGGTVSLTGGQFKSGPLYITGVNVSLDVEDGASLVAAFGPQHWPQITTAGRSNNRSCASGHRPCYQDFIVFRGCDGCSFKGSGTLSGRAVELDWYLLRNIVKNSSRLNASSPNMLTVVDSSDFVLSGVTILDAPNFNIELTNVTRAEISFINITSPWWTDADGKVQQPFNTDGIDPGAGSSDIWIHDCYISNGDDSIAVKPSTDTSSCTRNILVEDCVFERGRGCSIGSVGQGCISDVVFSNITMRSDTGGCRVKAYSTSAAGFVRNVTWRDISITGQAVPGLARSGGGPYCSYVPPGACSCLSVDERYKPVPKPTEHFVNVSGLLFENITGECSDPPEFACIAGSPCDVELRDIHISPAPWRVFKGKPFEMLCENVTGNASNVAPASCLKQRVAISDSTAPTVLAPMAPPLKSDDPWAFSPAVNWSTVPTFYFATTNLTADGTIDAQSMDFLQNFPMIIMPKIVSHSMRLLFACLFAFGFC
jgi:hypothetical protein